MQQTDAEIVSKVIALFRSRAYRSRQLAFTILSLIVLLLAGGATAFVFAPQIASSDINKQPDYDTRLKHLTAERDDLKNKIAGIESGDIENFNSDRKARKKWAAYVADCLRRVEDIFDDSVDKTPNAFPPDVTIDSSNSCNNDSIAKEIKRVLLSKEDARILFDYPDERRSSRYIVNRSSFEIKRQWLSSLTVVPDLPKPKEPSRTVYADEKDTSRLRLLEEAIELIQAQKRSTDLNEATGLLRTDTTSKDTEDKIIERSRLSPAAIQLLQTNITRFGTIIMIIFLVTILTPLYRYNIKLSSFYEARADALQLSGNKAKVVSFATLTNTLTPTFDFGKNPATPIEQLITLIKSIKDDKKNKDEEE